VSALSIAVVGDYAPAAARQAVAVRGVATDGSGVPLIGTCAGFQHIVTEDARFRLNPGCRAPLALDAPAAPRVSVVPARVIETAKL
jgi:hypothetical protein